MSDTPPPPAPWPLPLPESEDAIETIHRARKRIAIERARRSPFLAQRLQTVRMDALDDPEEWRRIPVLTKDELRRLSDEDFYGRFCIAGIAQPVEYWRSGGVTGKPLFYPRSAVDMEYGFGVGFRRIWPCIGATPDDSLHDAFPLGIHPVGQLVARSAELEGIRTLWAGAGTTTPTALQLQLIATLKPTILAGMSSYGLHLGNTAAADGIDLSPSSVRKVLVSAEPLTAAKRGKLERLWGAKVYNSFGMTEGGMMAVEREASGGMVAWSDVFLFEVIDATTGRPAPEGQEGHLVVTPLWSNTVTPFLRWLSGDIVTLRRQKRTEDPFSVFPVLYHALRTEGFFKIRGVNINHAELEDFMFDQRAVADFRAELATRDDRELLRLLIEVVRGSAGRSVAAALIESVRAQFEVTPEVEILAPGTLAQEFEKSVKAPRFVDRRT